RSTDSLNSPCTRNRRATGISSDAKIPAKASRQPVASRGIAKRQRVICGRTARDQLGPRPSPLGHTLLLASADWDNLSCGALHFAEPRPRLHRLPTLLKQIT